MLQWPLEEELTFLCFFVLHLIFTLRTRAYPLYVFCVTLNCYIVDKISPFLMFLCYIELLHFSLPFVSCMLMCYVRTPLTWVDSELMNVNSYLLLAELAIRHSFIINSNSSIIIGQRDGFSIPYLGIRSVILGVRIPLKNFKFWI